MPTTPSTPGTTPKRKNDNQASHGTWKRSRGEKDSHVRYSIAIPNDSESHGVLDDDIDLIWRLRDHALVPKTSRDALTTMVRDITHTGPTQVALEMSSKLRQQPFYDIELVMSAEELVRALDGAFQVIRIRANSRLINTHNWTFSNQIRPVSVRAALAYQPARAKTSDSYSHFVEPETLERIFVDGQAPTPLERSSIFFDMTSFAPFQFHPPEIDDVDLVRLITTDVSTGSSRHRGLDCHVPRERATASTAPSCQPFHTTAAGYCTAVVVAKGSTVWHTVCGDWDVNLRRLAYGGPRYDGYPNRVSAMKLHEGDCLIQAPGTIHAIINPEQSLVYEYPFYTAEHFARTIKCVRLGEAVCPGGEVRADDYDNLALILLHMHDGKLFTKPQREAVWAEVADLLLDARIIRPDGTRSPKRLTLQPLLRRPGRFPWFCRAPTRRPAPPQALFPEPMYDSAVKVEPLANASTTSTVGSPERGLEWNECEDYGDVDADGMPLGPSDEQFEEERDLEDDACIRFLDACVSFWEKTGKTGAIGTVAVR